MCIKDLVNQLTRKARTTCVPNPSYVNEHLVQRVATRPTQSDAAPYRYWLSTVVNSGIRRRIWLCWTSASQRCWTRCSRLTTDFDRHSLSYAVLVIHDSFHSRPRWKRTSSIDPSRLNGNGNGNGNENISNAPPTVDRRRITSIHPSIYSFVRFYC